MPTQQCAKHAENLAIIGTVESWARVDEIFTTAKYTSVGTNIGILFEWQ